MNRWLIIFGLLLGALSNAVYAPPHDFGWFLEDRKFFLIPDISGELPLTLDKLFENYFVHDEYGNWVLLKLYTSEQAFQDSIALAQLTEVAGVSSLTASPTLINRERHQILTVSEAREVFPPPATINEEDWIPAMFIPFQGPEQFRRYRNKGEQELSPRQMGQLVVQGLFAYVFGLSESPLSFTSDEDLATFCTKGLFSSFTGFEKETYKRYMQRLGLSGKILFPLAQLRALASSGDRTRLQEFFEPIEIFLSRVGSLVEPRADGGSLFTDITESFFQFPANAVRRSKITAVVRARAKNVGEEIKESLRSIGSIYRDAFPKISKVTINPLTVASADYIVPWNRPVSISSIPLNQSKRALWHYIFSNGQVKKQLKETWAKELGTQDPIGEIWSRATNFDNTMYLTYRDSVLETLQKPERPETQWHLNRLISPSLIVADPNDSESKRIIEITNHMAGILNQPGEVRLALYPNLPKYTQGESLRSEDYRKILAYARQHGFVRIFICELGNIDPSWLGVQGDDLIITHLDHHGINVGKSSTLEKFTGVWSYHLGIRGYLDAILDRSGVPGLRGLKGIRSPELSREEVKFIFQALGRLPRLERIEKKLLPLITKPGGKLNAQSLHVLYLPSGSLGNINIPLGYVYYPETPHLLIKGDFTVRFAGPFDLCEELHCEMEATETGKWLLGGDLNSGYLTFWPKNIRYMEATANRFQKALQRLHDYEGCVVELERSAFL